MKGKSYKRKIINYLYGSMTKTEMREFEKEVKSSSELKDDLKNLSQLRSLMATCKAPSGEKNIVNPIAIYAAAREKNLKNQKAFPLWLKAAFALGSVLVILSVINMNLSITKDSFHISFNLFREQQADLAADQFSAALEQNHIDLLEIVKNYIKDRDNKQIEVFSRLLSDYEIRSNLKRKYEIEAIYKEFENFRLNTNRYLVGANQAIEGLFQYVSMITPQKKESRGSI